MSHASPGPIDLSAVFAAVRQRAPRLVISSLLAGALTFLVLSLVAPRYQSVAELVVSPPGGAGMDRQAVHAHVQALRSPELIAAIAADLKLAERPEFNPELGAVDTIGRILRLLGIGTPHSGQGEQDRVLDRFYERLEVYSPQDGRAIAIRFTSHDPSLAAKLANALAEAYRERLQAQLALRPANAGSGALPVEARIVSRARAASAPVFPRKAPFAVLAAFATLLLGLALTITRAALAGSRSANAARPAAAAEALAAGKATAGRLQDFDLAAVEGPAQLERGAASATTHEHRGAPASLKPVVEADVARVSTIGALARRVAARSGGGGYRTLIAGETDMMGVSSHAIELAKALADLGQSVVCIDWAPEGDGVAHALALPPGPGISELLAGAASFEQIICRMPGSEAHVIAAGAFDDVTALSLDPDRLNLVLDALDEAYDQVIVAGRYESARALFEAIEGRVDCGVLVADPGRIGSVLRDPPGTYLGFEVAEIDLVRYDRHVPVGTGQRIIRAGRNPTAAAG